MRYFGENMSSMFSPSRYLVENWRQVTDLVLIRLL